jgi:hypothetical protein
MQRRYIESFTQDGFESRRHECANVAMAVYGLSPSRSRELYDLTMLEVRWVMYNNLPPRQPIAAGRLVGTRAQWMLRYAHLVNLHEKFVTLTKDLGSFVILLIDPSNRSRRQDRSAKVTRHNLDLVLNGHPEVMPLFSDHRRASEVPLNDPLASRPATASTLPEGPIEAV